MKFQSYAYSEKEVNLSFQFKEDEEILNNKITFLNLLRQAARDLEEEINADG